MEYSKFSIALLIRIGILLVPLGALTYAIHSNEMSWIIIASLISLGFGIHLYYFVIRRYKEISYFLESVKYRDFSRRFTEQSAPEDIIDLHKGFNTTIETIKDINTEKETQYIYLQKILEVLKTGIISYNVGTGEILWLNDSFQRILDIPSIKNIGFIEKRFAESFEKIFSANYSTGDTIAIKAQNEDLKYWITSSIFKVEGETFKLITLQNIDVSLNENESEAWKKLLSVMTHEIMNSVAPIASLAETLHSNIVDSTALDSPSKLDMADLEIGIDSIKNRSEGLMKFAKTYRSLNKITKLNKEDILVNYLFNNIFHLLEPSLKKKGITLKIEMENPRLQVNIDVHLIEQVLINLILNSVEAFEGSKDPKIILSAEKKLDGKTILSVKDNGNGIPEDIRKEIFVPFFTTKKNGNGIGLSLSRQIILLHKGKIQIRSAEGKGTSISLML